MSSMISLNYPQLFLIVIFLGYMAWQVWKQGIRTGAERAVTKLHELKIIAFDNVGNVKPNPFYEEHQKTKN